MIFTGQISDFRPNIIDVQRGPYPQQHLDTAAEGGVADNFAYILAPWFVVAAHYTGSSSGSNSMTKTSFKKYQLGLTLLASLYIWILLTIEHLNGGVVSHHLLNQPDLPAISNWWGALLMPALSWFLLGLVSRRVNQPYPVAVLGSFAAALGFGVLVSVLFLQGREQVLSQLMLSLPLLALFFPLYRAEFLLGFVLAMSYTFGVLLPAAFGTAILLMAALMYKGVRPVLLYLFDLLTGSKKTAG